MKSLTAEERHEITVKCWMTHDGLWFSQCLREFGIEATNKVNKAAGRALAAIEMGRIKKAFGLAEVENMEGLMAAFEAGWSVVGADFMRFDFVPEAGDVLHVEAKRCFAYEGMKRLGVADRYECGIFSRVEGWFDVLGARYTVTPEVLGCMMNDQGRCYRDYSFEF